MLLNSDEVPGFGVLSFTSSTELGGKHVEPGRQLPVTPVGQKIPAGANLEIVSRRDLFLKRMAPLNLSLINKAGFSFQQQ